MQGAGYLRGQGSPGQPSVSSVCTRVCMHMCLCMCISVSIGALPAAAEGL